MLLKNLPSKRKEVILYKIQVQDFLCWKELPKIYSTLKSARKDAIKNGFSGYGNSIKRRIVKRSDKGWEIVEVI